MKCDQFHGRFTLVRGIGMCKELSLEQQCTNKCYQYKQLGRLGMGFASVKISHA